MKENGKLKGSQDFRNQGMDYEEGIDNFVLVVGIYDYDSCTLAANLYHINLPIGCTEDVRT